MSALNKENYAQLLDNLPHVVMRLAYSAPAWTVRYVNKAIERWGYAKDDFADGKMTWNDLLHPDDRVVALKQSHDYMEKNIDDFRLQYRILTKDGASIYITEYSHVNHFPDGSPDIIDSYLVENIESPGMTDPQSDIAIRRHLVLNDILLTIQDAKADPELAIQAILDRAGTLLDCSRALLFKDSPDHKTCKVVYEWLNHGITSIKDLDYAVTYATEMPEIYVALQETGVLLVNAGEIPENCKEEFDAEGLVSSAIFAVYQYGDHYGFVCFDDCVIKRKWDPDTANFLKVVANLLSNVVMNLQSAKYMSEYEEKIKSLAFRDYLTGLPNRYPYDSDLGDAALAANAAGTPAYAVMIALNDSNAIRNAHGLKVTDQVCRVIADELGRELAETLADRAVLYRITGTVFSVLVQPGAVEPIREFAERVARRGLHPWNTGAGEYRCELNVAAQAFGVKTVDPDRINDMLDVACVKSAARTDLHFVFETDEV